jgi:hypothetical protein
MLGRTLKKFAETLSVAQIIVKYAAIGGPVNNESSGL